MSRESVEIVGTAIEVSKRGIEDAELRGRRRWSGRLPLPPSMIFTVRDEQIAKVQFSFDHAQALEAVGLSE